MSVFIDLLISPKKGHKHLFERIGTRETKNVVLDTFLLNGLYRTFYICLIITAPFSYLKSSLLSLVVDYLIISESICDYYCMTHKLLYLSWSSIYLPTSTSGFCLSSIPSVSVQFHPKSELLHPKIDQNHLHPVCQLHSHQFPLL